MKYLPLLFILSFYSVGQNTFTIDETTYLLDDTLVFVRFDMEPLNGIIYDNSHRKIGLYVDGRREGVHTVWHDNDYLLLKAEYK